MKTPGLISAIGLIAALSVAGVATASRFSTFTWGTSATSSYSTSQTSTATNALAVPAQSFGVECDVSPGSTGGTATGSFAILCGEDGTHFGPLSLGSAQAAGTDAGTFLVDQQTTSTSVLFALPAHTPCAYIEVAYNATYSDGGVPIACHLAPSPQ